MEFNNDFIKLAGSAVGIAVAAASRVFGKKVEWLPLDEDARKLAFRVTMLLAAAGIVLMWLLSSRVGPTALAVTALALSLLTAAVYVALRGILNRVTFQRTTASNEVVPVLGGFKLTEDAQDALEEAGSVQELFKGRMYKPELVWTASSLAKTEMLVTALFVALFALGSVGFSSIGLALGDEDERPLSLATVQTAVVERKAQLKTFLRDDKWTDSYSRKELGLRGCVVRVVTRIGPAARNTRLTIGGRLFVARDDAAVTLAAPALPVVSHTFTSRSTRPMTVRIWLQLPREQRGLL
jgi:hypothetical protein